jgi:uncharacterized protein (TIGR03000 family)
VDNLAANDQNSGAPIENQYADTQQNNAQRPPLDQLASNDEMGNEEEEDGDTVDYRGAIYLALPSKDAQVFLNGNPVPGEGDQRVLLTPEIDNENDQAEKFDIRTVWNENGREQNRETNVQVAAGGGVAVNFTKPIDPQKPFIALYQPQYGDDSEGDEQGTEATAQQEPAQEHHPASPHAHRATEAARPTN